MRITSRLVGGVVGLALVAATAACGGGTGTGAPAGSTSSSPVVQTTPAAPVSTGLPAKSLCDTFSAQFVQQLVGVTIYSADDNDPLAGPQRVVCMYYTSQDQSNYIEIHWMTVAQADWTNAVLPVHTSSNGETITSGTTTVLSNDAVKSTDVNVGILPDGGTLTTTDYQVLLKNRGIVVAFANSSTTGVANDKFLDLVEAVVRATNTL